MQFSFLGGCDYYASLGDFQNTIRSDEFVSKQTLEEWTGKCKQTTTVNSALSLLCFQFHRAECVFYAKSLGKKTLNHSQKQRCNNSERNCRGEEGFLQGPYSNSLSHLDLVSCEEGYTTLSSSASKLGHFRYCCTLYTTKIVDSYSCRSKPIFLCMPAEQSQRWLGKAGE